MFFNAETCNMLFLRTGAPSPALPVNHSKYTLACFSGLIQDLAVIV